METQSFRLYDCTAKVVVLENGKVFCRILHEKDRWTIGRKTPENSPDIALSSPIASRNHGELLCIDGQWLYCYRGSLNPTYHNGKRIRAGLNGRAAPVSLSSGDVIRIDTDNLDMPDVNGVLLLFVNDCSDDNWSYISCQEAAETFFGRDDTACQIVLHDPFVSRKHACIVALNGQYYLSDCNSKDGTKLNGRTISSTELLREKDKISISDYSFIFTGRGVLFCGNIKNSSTG